MQHILNGVKSIFIPTAAHAFLPKISVRSTNAITPTPPTKAPVRNRVIANVTQLVVKAVQKPIILPPSAPVNIILCNCTVSG